MAMTVIAKVISLVTTPTFRPDATAYAPQAQDVWLGENGDDARGAVVFGELTRRGAWYASIVSEGYGARMSVRW